MNSLTFFMTLLSVSFTLSFVILLTLMCSSFKSLVVCTVSYLKTKT